MNPNEIESFVDSLTGHILNTVDLDSCNADVDPDKAKRHEILFQSTRKALVSKLEQFLAIRDYENGIPTVRLSKFELMGLENAFRFCIEAKKALGVEPTKEEQTYRDNLLKKLSIMQKQAGCREQGVVT